MTGAEFLKIFPPPLHMIPGHNQEMTPAIAPLLTYRYWLDHHHFMELQRREREYEKLQKPQKINT
jgi:hypothetical protein